GMRVNDRLHIRPRLVDRQVQQDLARALALAADLLALHVGDAQIFGRKVALADAGRRAEDAVLADAIGMVSFVAGAEPFLPDAAADVAPLFIELDISQASRGHGA